MVKLYNHNEHNSVISVFHQHLKKETTTNGFVSEKLNYMMKSLMQVKFISIEICLFTHIVCCRIYFVQFKQYISKINTEFIKKLEPCKP